MTALDFDSDPFADPYFADVARLHGLTPDMLAWDANGQAKPGDDAPEGMPLFAYRTAHRIAHIRYGAHLVVYHDEVNYARSGEERSLHVHRVIPDAALAVLMGRPLSDVVNHPALEAHPITRIDVDEQRGRTTFRSDVSENTPRSD